MRKYIFFAGILFLASCSDFLEPNSQSEYVPKTATAINEMLIGNAYPRSSGGGNIFAYSEIFDDDITIHNSKASFDEFSSGKLGSYRAIYSWQPDMFITMENARLSISNIWEGYYQYILGTNAALDYINDVTGSAEEKNIVKAQALALRAYYYFMLVNHFGKPYNYDKKALGVPLKLDSNVSTNLLSRNTVEEVYKQITSDINESEKIYESLPKEMQFRKDFRTSLPMVQLLKSRVALYMEDWSTAEKYADKVIKEWSFSLLDLNSIVPTEAKPYYNLVSMDCPETIWTFGKIGDINTHLGIYATYKEGENTTISRRFFNISEDLLNLYVNGDLRKERYIVHEKVKDVVITDVYIPYGKYAIKPEYSPEETEYFGRAFRLAEAYLNLAEAAAMNNHPDIARETLTTLLDKRFQSGTRPDVNGLSGSNLIDRIHLERRLELCLEGHRWFDLRRYGMPSFSREWRDAPDATTVIYTLEKGDPSYTMPIPLEVIRANKKIEQNELAPKRNYTIKQ